MFISNCNLIKGNKYSSILNPDFFDNYFSFAPKSSINQKEVNQLLSNINSPEEYNKVLKDLFDNDKLNEYIKYLNSSESHKFKTKENILKIIKNFLLLSDIEVINLLLSSRYQYFLFHEYYPDAMMRLDISNLISENPYCFISNFAGVIALICQMFNFPVNKPPELSDNEREQKVKLIVLTKNNLNNLNLGSLTKTYSGILYLDCLYKYFDLKIEVKDFVNKLLEDENNENLLDLILTEPNLLVEGAKYYTVNLFKALQKGDKLREILLELKYTKNNNDKKYYSQNEYDEEIFKFDELIGRLFDQNLRDIMNQYEIDLRTNFTREEVSKIFNELAKLQSNEQKFIYNEFFKQQFDREEFKSSNFYKQFEEKIKELEE